MEGSFLFAIPTCVAFHFSLSTNKPLIEKPKIFFFGYGSMYISHKIYYIVLSGNRPRECVGSDPIVLSMAVYFDKRHFDDLIFSLVGLSARD